MNLNLLTTTIGFALALVGCGTLVTYRRCDGFDIIERFTLRLVTGAAVVPVTVIALFELLRVPVHVLALVLPGMVGLVFTVLDERSLKRSVLVDRWTSIVVALLFIGTFLATLSGALRFPGFGGRDPWHHTLGTAWVLESGQLRQPFADWPILHYVDGYPPGFEVLLTFFCSLSGNSVADSLKTVTALIGAISILAMYFLGRRVIGSPTGGVLASILYSVAPGALGRHAWGHSMAVVLILAGLACAIDLRRSHRLLPAAALCFGGAGLMAPSQGAKGMVLIFLTTAVAWIHSNGWGRRVSIASVGAGLIASIWFVPLLLRTGIEPITVYNSMDNPELRRTGVRWDPEAGEAGGLSAALSGSSHRPYGLDDYLFFRPHVSIQPVFGPKHINFIVPEGIGIPVLSLALFGLLLRSSGSSGSQQPPTRVVLGLWLAFTALGTAGASIGISFYVWRFWLLLVPIASVTAALGAVCLFEQLNAPRGLRIAIWAAICAVLAQFVLALITDIQSRLWGFWFLNPVFLIVVSASVFYAVRLFIRSPGVVPKLATMIVMLHVIIASPPRLRALTAPVEPLGFANTVEANGFLGLRDVTPERAVVFALSAGNRNALIVGLDRVARPWDTRWHKLERDLIENPCDLSPSELVDELQVIGVEFLVLDPSYRARIDHECQDPTRFRATVIALLEEPNTSLISSFPPADQPSDSRVVVLQISEPSMH